MAPHAQRLLRIADMEWLMRGFAPAAASRLETCFPSRLRCPSRVSNTREGDARVAACRRSPESCGAMRCQLLKSRQPSAQLSVERLSEVAEADVTSQSDGDSAIP